MKRALARFAVDVVATVITLVVLVGAVAVGSVRDGLRTGSR